MGSTELEAFFLCLAKVPVLGITFLIEYPLVNRCFARGEITDSIFRIRFVDSNIRSGVFPFFFNPSSYVSVCSGSRSGLGKDPLVEAVGTPLTILMGDLSERYTW